MGQINLKIQYNLLAIHFLYSSIFQPGFREVFWGHFGVRNLEKVEKQGYTKLYRKIPWDIYRGMEIP
jgi:hypothetical protein